MTRRAALTTCFLLAACVETLPMNQTVNGSTRRAVEHQYATAGSVLRSYHTNAEGKRVEVAGALCSGRNAWVSFRNAVTPVVVTLPTYLQAERFSDRGKPPPLEITCKLNGKTVRFAAAASSIVSHTTTYGAGSYNAATGTYAQPVSTELTGRLSPTLPWTYGNISVAF